MPVDRYLCMSVDVVGYGGNDDVRQAVVQDQLIGLLDAAAVAAGLDRGRWLRQAKGDEELSLIPSSEALPRVVGDFCQQLDVLVRQVNLARGQAERLRLRLAMDEGPAEPAANGYAGRAVVGVSRLVNSSAVRQALAAADDASLAVIVSGGVYRDWIKSRRSSLQPGWLRAVRVVEKEVDEQAWLWVPGVDTHSLALEPPVPAPQPVAPAAGQQSVTIHFAAAVTNEGGHNVYGIRNG